MSALNAGSRKGVGANTFELVRPLPGHIDHNCRNAFIGMHMSTAQMLAQIFLTREPIASAAIAVCVWTHQRLLGIGVFLVNFALVAEKATGVGEALHLITTWLVAFIRAIMLIHVFTIGEND